MVMKEKRTYIKMKIVMKVKGKLRRRRGSFEADEDG
jgi:hypothetical protein